jgi:hypothetical protein
MYSELQRQLLFIGVCIPVRLTMIYIVNKLINTKYKFFIKFIYLVLGLLFMYRFIQFSTKDRGGFGNKVWWNDLRLVHSLMYIAFILTDDIRLLLINVMLGVLGFINNYFIGY